MKTLKVIICLSAAIVLQSVIFARISFPGAGPDLVLVMVIILAVTQKRNRAVAFSALLGFLQDLLSTGMYINLMVKVAVCSIVSGIKEEFIGDENALILGMAAVFTPLILALEAAGSLFFMHRQFSLYYFIFRLAAGTLYNMLLVPLLIPMVRWAMDGE